MSIKISRPTRRVELCTRLDLLADYEALLAETKQTDFGPDTEGGNPRTKLLREANTLGEKIRENTVIFVLQGLPRQEWADLVYSNPPRPGVEDDAALHMNAEAFNSMIPKMFISITNAVTGEPVEADWVEFSPDLTDAQYAAFVKAAWELNRAVTAAPKALSSKLLATQPTENE